LFFLFTNKWCKRYNDIVNKLGSETMIQFINDILAFLTSLSAIDYILYFSVIVLIILVVSLIYVIQNENMEEKSILKTEIEPVKPVVEEKQEELDLLSIVDTIDENPKPLVDMTAYEEEQEQKAIISYEELIKGVKQKEISYEKEEMVDDVIPVKRISISPIEKTVLPKMELTPKEPKIEVSVTEERKEESKVKLFSYEKEEAFLKALQQLNELLN